MPLHRGNRRGRCPARHCGRTRIRTLSEKEVGGKCGDRPRRLEIRWHHTVFTPTGPLLAAGERNRVHRLADEAVGVEIGGSDARSVAAPAPAPLIALVE